MTDAHSTSHPSGHGHMDMAEHLKTWKGFMRLVRWGIAAVVALLVFLAIFRTHG